MIPMQGTQGRKTLVEEGTSFKGSLSSTCPVEVKGRVEGDVTAPALSVSASGSVHGKVKVGEMQSHGELAGEFDADVVQLQGTVKDRTIIRAKSLEVKLSPTEGKMQVVFGECQLEVAVRRLGPRSWREVRRPPQPVRTKKAPKARASRPRAPKRPKPRRARACDRRPTRTAPRRPASARRAPCRATAQVHRERASPERRIARASSTVDFRAVVATPTSRSRAGSHRPVASCA